MSVAGSKQVCTTFMQSCGMRWEEEVRTLIFCISKGHLPAPACVSFLPGAALPFCVFPSPRDRLEKLFFHSFYGTVPALDPHQCPI
jgi:hypothetical protein